MGDGVDTVQRRAQPTPGVVADTSVAAIVRVVEGLLHGLFRKL